MRSFSIVPSSDVSCVDQYADFLTNEVYRSINLYLEEDINNPLFLQKVGLLRAQGIHRAVETNGAVLYEGFQHANDNIKRAAICTAGQMHMVADKLTTSLDDGFTALGYGLSVVNQNLTTANQMLNNIQERISQVNTGVAQTNKSIQQLGVATVQGFSLLHNDILQLNSGVGQMLKNQNLTNLSLMAIGSMLGTGFSMIKTCFFELNNYLNAILTELRIPETQRERRYHIEQGSKYLKMAILRNDKYYFEDALDEFNKSIAIERKDYFSWYNIGIIYLRSPYGFDVLKAIEAFERYIHYAKAEFQYSNTNSLRLQIDEVQLLMAEAHYINNQLQKAIECTTHCNKENTKAKLMRVKYLSATKEINSQKEAASILEQLLRENPLLSLEILDDADILSNSSIISLLEQLRLEAVDEAKKQYINIHLIITGYYHIIKEFNDNSKIYSLLLNNKYLDAYEAMCLMEEFKQKHLDKISSCTNNYKEFYEQHLQDGTKILSNTQFTSLIEQLRTRAIKIAKQQFIDIQQIIIGSSKLTKDFNINYSSICSLIHSKEYIDAQFAMWLIKKIKIKHNISM